MANSTHPYNISMCMTSLGQWFQKNLLHPIGFMQIGAVGVSYLLAWLFAAKVQHRKRHLRRPRSQFPSFQYSIIPIAERRRAELGSLV